MKREVFLTIGLIVAWANLIVFFMTVSAYLTGKGSSPLHDAVMSTLNLFWFVHIRKLVREKRAES